jgi:hypothetical protein
LAAVIGRSRREPGYYYSSGSSGLEPEVYDRRSAEYSPEPSMRETTMGREPTMRAWDKIKDALVAAALTQVENVVQEVLPDFSLRDSESEPRRGRGETGSANQTVH